MVDFHTHILPGIDDGSQDENMTQAMIWEEKRQGVDQIVATPHFYADEMSIDRFLENRAAALETARGIAASAQDSAMPELFAGAEVYYFQGIGRGKGIDRLCIEGTRTLLLEMPFVQWDKTVYRDVEELIRSCGLKIVLAHIERYFTLQKDRSAWESVLELPLLAQINAGSFLRRDRFFRADPVKKFSMEYLKDHPDALILGSDCHNMTGRKPNLAAGREAIAAALGEEALRRIDRTTALALAAA